MVRGPRTAMRNGPRLPQLERALAQKRRPNIAIKQSINQSIKKKKTLKKKRKKHTIQGSQYDLYTYKCIYNHIH